MTFFVRLYDALELLRGFFSAHGRGLDENSLAGPEYLTLERQLRVGIQKAKVVKRVDDLNIIIK